MPEYRQAIGFEHEFVIKAQNAQEANEKLEELIHEVEWQSDVRNSGYYDFEDEPVECPKCKGNCLIGDDEKICDRCEGKGSVPFGTEGN